MNTGQMLMLSIKYRIRYYWRAMLTALCVCPDCWARMNITRKGRKVCPNKLWHRK